MSEEFPHQFFVATIRPMNGTYSRSTYNIVKEVLEKYYVHWSLCEESGKADEVNHVHAAVYTDEPDDRMIKNWNQRMARHGIKQIPGYDRYRTHKVVRHQNCFGFGYVKKERWLKEDSNSPLMARLLEQGAADFAAAPNLKDNKKEREYRDRVEAVRDAMVSYVYEKHAAAAASFNSRKHEYESPWAPRPDIWKVQKLAAAMYRDEVEGWDRHMISFCQRNGPIIHEYLEAAIAESENFAQEQKERSEDSRVLLGKRTREAEASEAVERKLAQRKAKCGSIAHSIGAKCSYCGLK